MPMTTPASEADWLALRHQVVSSTESAALFGLSPYQTAFELANQKLAKEPPRLDMTGRMKWGLRAQEMVAKGISEDYGIKVRRVRGFATHPDIKLGASFDYEIIGIKTDESGAELEVEDNSLQQMYRDLGPGILEIKNVDAYIFRRDWKKPVEEVAEGVEAPPHFEIQVQHQLAAIGTRAWSTIGVLIGGNETFLVLREKDDDFIGTLQAKVEKFWTDLANGELPPPVLPADMAAIRQLYLASDPAKVFDGRGNEELRQLCITYKESAALRDKCEEARQQASVRILQMIGDNGKAITDGYSISASTTPAAWIEGYERKAFRALRINEPKGKANAAKAEK